MNRVIYSLLLCLGFLLPKIYSQNVQLEILNSGQGLSQGMIYDILQDHHGFLWFTTRGGLNRYDGYTFKVFKNDPFNPFSISDNTIQAILEDKHGRLWLGTENNGIDVFDPRSGQFYHLKEGNKGLSDANVISLAETSDGAIWVGTHHGLNRIELKTLPKASPDLSSSVKVEQFFWETPSENTLLVNSYDNLLSTADGNLWVATAQQAFRYNLKSRKKKQLLTYESGTATSWQTNYFEQDPFGNIWLGQNNRVVRFRGDTVDTFNFPETALNYKTYLAFDQQGNLYVGRRKFVYFFAQAELAKNQAPEPKVFCSFPEKGVIGSTKILCDRNGLIWIGTNGYGVRKYNLVNQFFENLLPGISVRQLCADRFGQIWAWDNQSLIKRIDEASKTGAEPFIPGTEFFHHDLLQARDSAYWLLAEYRSGPSGKGVLLQKNFKTGLIQSFPCPLKIGIFSQIIEDKDGNIWVCGRESTLAQFDVRSKKFTTYDLSNLTGSKEPSHTILNGKNGAFWIGTPHGLIRARLNQEGKLQFRLFQCDPQQARSLSANAILSLCDDPQNPETILWVGTRGGGLNAFNKKNGQSKHYTISHGLPDDVIYGILPDDRGNLWISTNSGLSKFDPRSEHFENYSVADGLQDNEFNTVSYTKGYDGRMFFGGVNGITAFYPEKIAPNAKAPKVFITALKVNNKLFVPEKGKPQQLIEYSSAINLPYNQNQLTIDFVAMDFTNPYKNQFTYRLSGADKTWVSSTTAHSVNYSNLAPGSYVFEVASGGPHGVWPSQASRKLSIRILPPWWKSPFAYLAYAILIILAVNLFIRWQVRQHKTRNQREFEKRELARIQALEQLKSNFFTNITHELRTPLTLVIEPLRQVLKQPDAENWLNNVQIAERSGSRLLHLVNQLLDLAKLEAGAMALELRRVPIDAILRQTAAIFAEQAARKHLLFKVQSSVPPVGEVLFDQDKLEKIVVNLLSNALKYTSEGGQVSLRWHVEVLAGEAGLILEVKDTGPGIPLEHQPHVFERFYSLDQNTTDGQASTGVGLSLCKELVEIMGGKIELKSEPGNGTLFRVSLPLQQSAAVQMDASYKGTTLPSFMPQEQENNQVLILLVEDDAEMRNFITGILNGQYQIINAENGQQGLQLAQEHTPDLIISDLVMPEMDGFELLGKLKNDLSTSHIPVILLTAKASLENRLSGLKHGAEAYLQKPFHTEELQAWIYSILKNRQQLQQRYTNKSQIIKEGSDNIPALPAISAQDQEFLQRLEEIIKQELENEDLSVEDLARMMFLSRSQLHRKVIALTGLSSTELIRKLRLDHAMLLLQNEKGKIAEIAQRAGFRNVKYFSTAFKEYFGKSPSEI